jgi:hypothetical protein
MCFDWNDAGCTCKLNQRIACLCHLKILLVVAGPETTLFVFDGPVGIAKLAFQAQRIVALIVRTARVFHPLAGTHAGIRTGIYLAEGVYRHIKRIAAKVNMIEGISEQSLLILYRILLPFALQVALPRCLLVGIEPAGRAVSS